MIFRKPSKSGVCIAVAELLMGTQIVLGVPAPTQAASEVEEPAPAQAAAEREEVAGPQSVAKQKEAAAQAPPEREPEKVKVNRTVPPVTPRELYPKFSASPTDEEIFRARVFEEPLVPIGGATSVEENQALAGALMAYLRAGGGENVSLLETFLKAHPESAWQGSLLTNLGNVYRRTGYFTRALSAWERAWELTKKESEPRAKAIADRALGQLVQLNGRLGRYERLEEIFSETEGREVLGSATEKLSGAKQGLWLMRNRPEEAFLCGPRAVDRILAYGRADYRRDPKIEEFPSTLQGTSLIQVRDLARSVGLNLQMAKRVGGEFLMPAVAHWKAGHFAALLTEEGGRYLTQDPTFGEELWVSRAALEDETSGYFLVREGSLPSGWESVSEAEGRTVWGKGSTDGGDPDFKKPCDDTEGGEKCEDDGDGSCSEGLATYRFHSMLISLNIRDTPVSYSPPRGPRVRFLATYGQREAFQPQLFSYSNLGRKWTFDWLSYVQDDPATPSQPADVYVRGGGVETYTGFDSATQSYAPHVQTRAVLVRTSTSPIGYERRRPDGAVEVFSQPDGAASFPRKVFMTQSIDPQGNALSITYDASLRIVAVTDALGQVTTVSYELAGDSLKITKVTDPFGRFARFDYNASGQLIKITDVIGLTSEFEYGSGDFITALITAYGRTSFVMGEGGFNGRDRWLEATDPLGGRERIEYQNEWSEIPYSDPPAIVPPGFDNIALNFRNTFYWDKRAMALYPGEHTKAKILHWLKDPSVILTSGTKGSEKLPLENRVWYRYPGQVADYQGTMTQPSEVARVLDDGSTQSYRYEYNSKGKVTKYTDPVGRETVYVYGTGTTPDPDPAAGTGIDLLEVNQKNGSTYDLLRSATYNSQHLPLTRTDAAGQTTTYTFNSPGQILTLTTPERAGITENRTTTWSYDTNGYLQSVTGPATGATHFYTYDGYGRVRTETDPDSYTLTYDYDALDRQTRVTYPDGTYDEVVYNRLDAERQRDRGGRWSHTSYDALRRAAATRDAQGGTTALQWCTCGSLDKFIDANGNATTWERDVQGRVTKETRSDGAEILYVYENTTSRLKRATDAKGQHKDYQYYRDDKLQQVSYPNAQISTATASFVYDSNYNRLATVTDGTGTTVYTYNPISVSPSLGAGRLASVDGPLANDVITYSYDELGRVVARGINGSAATFSFDVLGRLSGESNTLGSFTFSYDGVADRVLSATYPNGQTTNYSYYPNPGDRRLQEIHHRRFGGLTLSKFTYTYDAMGDILTWSQQTDSNPAKVFDLTYDRVEQVTSATWRITDPTPVVLKRYAYSYDPAGNRTTEQIDDAATAATYDNVNRLTSQQPGGALRFKGTLNEAATVTVQGKPASVSADNKFEGPAQVASGTNTVEVKAKDYSGNERTNTYQVDVSGSSKTYTYDANGNLTADGTRTFEWDGANRMTAIVQATKRSEFSYDAWGHRARIVEKDNGATITDTRFLWCGMQICEERDSSGGVVLRRFYGNGMQDGGVSFFYTTDHLQSVRELTDASGSIRARYEYDPYGRATKTSGDKDSVFTFTGHFVHRETGLMLAPFRAYDPAVGRWVSRDPIGLSGGLNPYSYVAGRPTAARDSLGLAGEITIAPAVEQVVKVGFQYVEPVVKTTGTGALLLCLGVLALLCQKGDGHGPGDPQGRQAVGGPGPRGAPKAGPRAPKKGDRDYGADCDAYLKKCIERNIWCRRWEEKYDCRSCWEECDKNGYWPHYKCDLR